MNRTKKFLVGAALSVLAITMMVVSSSDTSAAEKERFSPSGFTLSQDVRLDTVSSEPALDRLSISLPAGTEVVLLDRKEDSKLGALVRVGIDAEEGSALPSDFWVRAGDLPVEVLVPNGPGVDEAGGNFPSILKKMTYCFRYVKQYLMQTGQVRVYLPGSSAYQAASILPRYGFRRTGHSPSSASNGEVCVYGGGPQGHGHIEVKRNGRWWYGYGFKASPISGRRFIGCYAK